MTETTQERFLKLLPPRLHNATVMGDVNGLKKLTNAEVDDLTE